MLRRALQLTLLGSILAIACLGLPVASPAQETAPAASEPAAPAEHSPAATDPHAAPYSIWSDLPFWSLIAFLGVILAVKKLGLWDLLLRTMSEREQAEASAIQLAESHLSSAQAGLRDAKSRIQSLDGNIREILAEAQRDAVSAQNDILAIAEQEVQIARQRAELEVSRSRDGSLHDIFSTLASKVTRLAENRLRSGLQADDHARLIAEALNGFASDSR